MVPIKDNLLEPIYVVDVNVLRNFLFEIQKKTNKLKVVGKRIVYVVCACR